MALPLRLSTANQVMVIGPFLNSTDGVTPMTGLTIANTDIKLYKHNNAAAASKNNGGGANAAGGWYNIALDDTDTNTIGRMQLSCQMAGCLPVWHELAVHNAVWYDTAHGTDYLTVDMIQISGANVNNGANQLGVNVVSVAANAVTAAAFNQAAADKVWGTAARTLTASDNIFAANVITAASFNQGAADKVWSTAARTLTAGTNIFSANIIDAASFNQGAADKVWASAGRTLTGAANITSNNNKLVLSTDDKVLLAGTTHTGAIIPVVSAVNNVTGSVATVTAFADNSVTAAAFNQAAADKVWGTAARTLTAATNLTSNGNAVVLHTDDKVIIAGTTHTSAIIPTVSALTGHTAQTGDTFSLANGASGFVALKADTANILDDTGANGVLLAANALTAAAMNTDAGPEIATAVWGKTDAVLSQTYAALMERLYRFFMNKMAITDATGAVALRNEADDGDLATQTLTDDDTTTIRTALTWA